MKVEKCRRKHPRFQVVLTSIAAMTSGSSKSGEICDMSLGGLSFNYMEGEEKSSRPGLMAIIVQGYGVYIEELEVDTAWDSKIDATSPYSLIPMRRMGVRFKNLTSRQRFQLESFMRSNTGGKFNGGPSS